MLEKTATTKNKPQTMPAICGLFFTVSLQNNLKKWLVILFGWYIFTHTKAIFNNG